MPITAFQEGILKLLAAHRSPDSFVMGVIEEAKRTAHYTVDDFRPIQLTQPLDLPALYQTWRDALAQADALITRLPEGEVGCLYLDEQNHPVTPDPSSAAFPRLRRHFGSVRGAWPVVRD